jgi:hypothetical protein
MAGVISPGALTLRFPRGDFTRLVPWRQLRFQVLSNGLQGRWCSDKSVSAADDDGPERMADHFYSPEARLDLLEIWEQVHASMTHP